MSFNDRAPVEQRRALAQALVSALDLPGGAEAVLTGSVARGVADRYSDIELRVLVTELPSPEQCEAQLASAGLTVDPATSVWNGMITTKSWHDGVLVEAAWQTFAGLDAALEPVAADATTEHWALVEGWHIVHAVPLTAAPRLAAWQARLATYPPTLQAKLVASATATWAQPHWYPLSPANLWPVARRGSQLALAGKLIQEVERCLRLLFAINQVWEPDYKWLAHEQQRLQLAPAGLVERVNAVFAAAEPDTRVHRCLDLIADALALVPAPYDVALQRQRIAEAHEPD
jgi:hypothetical protein